MIVVVGVLADPVIRRVCAGLLVDNAPFELLDPRLFPKSASLEVGFNDGILSGVLSVGPREYRLSEIASAFVRLTATRTGNGTASEASAWEYQLVHFLDLLPGPVVNRPGSEYSNSAKPLQYGAIQSVGFDVPPTLVTNETTRARQFVRSQGFAVSKSVSYVRCRVAIMSADVWPSVATVVAAPVQLQRLVHGTDVRVHVVGEECLATSVRSSAEDYRYPSLAEEWPRLEPLALPDPVSARCVKLARILGLELAGIDFRVTEDERWYCFEVNPMPFFSYYEGETFAVTRAVVRLLQQTPPSLPVDPETELPVAATELSFGCQPRSLVRSDALFVPIARRPKQEDYRGARVRSVGNRSALAATLSSEMARYHVSQ